MSVTVSPPRRLLTVEYTSTAIGTTTTGTGAALSPAWGGSFVVANRTTVEIELSILDAALTPTGAGVDAVIVVDGTEVLFRRHFPWNAAIGSPIHARTRLAGLSAGSHTIAVQMRVGAGTGTFTCSSTQRGLLTVDEVD